MEIKLQFVTRNIAGDTLLVPVGKTSLDLNGMITVNEMGAEIWKMLPDVKDEEEIVQRILAEYDADAQTVRVDVQEFVERLRKLGII